MEYIPLIDVDGNFCVIIYHNFVYLFASSLSYLMQRLFEIFELPKDMFRKKKNTRLDTGILVLIILCCQALLSIREASWLGIMEVYLLGIDLNIDLK